MLSADVADGSVALCCAGALLAPERGPIGKIRWLMPPVHVSAE
jgi:hypothetical protein